MRPRDCLWLILTASFSLPPDQPRAGDEGLKAVAGSYYRGDGLGTNCSLAIDAEGSFTFQNRGCLGLYDRNSGTAELADGRLLLHPESPALGHFLATEFVSVRWGERTYLVPKDKGRAFCRAITQGLEPRDGAHGYFYLRRKDWEKAVTGKPAVPSEWEEYLKP